MPENGKQALRRRPLWARAAVVGLALLLGGCATIQRDDLSGYVEQLHSDASEGVQVARQAAVGRAPVIFVWLESAELLHQAGEVKDHLDGEMVAADVGAQVKTAKGIVKALSDDLGALHTWANNRAAAASLVSRLSGDAHHAESLYTGLQ